MRHVGRVVFVTIVMSALACRTYDTIYTTDAGGQCVTPNMLCDGTCVDISSDRLHCGGCTTTCSINALCASATCTFCPGASEIVCGSSGASFCTDVSSDRANCGACDAPCNLGEACVAGKCTCPLTTCGDACIDTQTDVNHCGGCDSPCPAPAASEVATCSAGHCSVQCITPFADCDGVGSNGCETNLQTTSNHCGSCTRDCGSGQTCSSGMCPVKTFGTGSQLAGLAVDATNVYWVDQSATAGGIFSQAIGGGSSQLVFSDNVATVLAVGSGRIAWMHVNTQIESRLLSGGSTTLLATTSGAQTLIASNGFAYFSTAANDVSRVPLDGSTGAVLITTSPTPMSLAVDATTVYAATSGGDIVFAPITGQNVGATSFETGTGAIDLAVDASHVYWATGTGLIVSQPKLSGNATNIVLGENVVTNLVTDGVSLYWGNADGSVRKTPITGGTPLKLAIGQGSITAIAVDAKNVYWTTPTAIHATPN